MRSFPGLVLIASSCAACVGSHGAGAPGHASAGPAPAAAAPGQQPSFTPPTLRLPEGTRPVSERVSLTLVPSENTFEGEATVELKVEKASPVLWLNATDLTVDTAVFSRGGHEEPSGSRGRGQQDQSAAGNDAAQ